MSTMDTIKNIFSGRDKLVTQLRTLEAQHAEASAERARALAEADAAAAKIRAVLDAPERLRAASAAASETEERARIVLEQELRAKPSDALKTFQKTLRDVSKNARHLEKPKEVKTELVNWPLTDERTVVNLDEIEAYAQAGPTLARLAIEVRDHLWKLSDAELAARLDVLRPELEAAEAAFNEDAA